MKKMILPLVALSLMLSCSLPGTITAFLERLKPEEAVEPEQRSLMPLIEKDRIRVISTRGSQGINGFSGEVIDLELYNNAKKTLEVSIPCGLVFIPSDENTSQMMVVQALEFQLQAGETRVVNPFVLSIETAKWMPAPEKTYRVDELQEGKQLQLAQCLCNEELPSETQEMVSVQLAAWMVANESVFTNTTQDLNDLLKNFTGLPIDIPGLDQSLQDLAGNVAPKAQAWLEKCEIESGK